MKNRLMDVLACPICKNYPLELHVFETTPTKGKTEEPKSTCELFCSYEKVKPSEIDKRVILEQCRQCSGTIIKSGIIICNRCKRWYPIVEEIPVMLPDDLRDVQDDINFLKMFSNKIPEDTLKRGLPTHL